VLFVDDEQHVLDGLRASLRHMRKEWSMEFACGGAEAVSLLEQGGFDALVTDMRMPGIDGEGVLDAARRHCPTAVRIVLSGQTDRTVVKRTMGVAHRFLSKPCRGEEVKECLAILLRACLPLDPVTRQIVCQVSYVPALPQTLARLGTPEDAPLAPSALSELLERDCALAAKLLHVANGGFFCTPQHVVDVQRALELVGVDVLASIVKATLPSSEPEFAQRLTEHCFQSGRLLADAGRPGHAVSAGILHGVGKLVLLAHFKERYGALLERASHTKEDLAALELSELGTTHARVAAHLIELWGLAEIAETLHQTHNDSPRRPSVPAALLSACDQAGGCTHS
jgi:HD-like signal output (HDOD) protein